MRPWPTKMKNTEAERKVHVSEVQQVICGGGERAHTHTHAHAHTHTHASMQAGRKAGKKGNENMCLCLWFALHARTHLSLAFE